ncbi:hypothetical protein [Membranihabitans maritimus]|uniref:hypothetical protein n=1 Tax=Membranihabitans maritimus TaxID=2904244 RepID=UPI001F381F42|nr:hypothetical protein [Membranihabitans maritimus]
MTRTLLLLVFFGLLTSCTRNKDEISPGLVGSWKLIESLADPGDGSGTYQAVEDGKIIEFTADNTIISRGTFCLPDTVSAVPRVVATYSVNDSIIIPMDCESGWNTHFELMGPYLILSNPYCIEPCLQKYARIDH